MSDNSEHKDFARAASREPLSTKTGSMPDLQKAHDDRKIAIDKVGVKDIRYPIVVLDKSNEQQQTNAHARPGQLPPARSLAFRRDPTQHDDTLDSW